MEVSDAIKKRRTIRRFKQKPIPEKTLRNLIEAARVAPSAANLQPLEYLVITDKFVKEKVFSTLSWAGYIAPSGNPKEGEKPTAYIAILVNTKIRDKDWQWDVGAAVENILLMGMGGKIGGCWIATINRDKLRALLNIPKHLNIDSVVALGYPAEKPVLEEAENFIRYWKDKRGVLHVPKRKLEDILHFNHHYE
jgi:nitroreductase